MESTSYSSKTSRVSSRNFFSDYPISNLFTSRATGCLGNYPKILVNYPSLETLSAIWSGYRGKFGGDGKEKESVVFQYRFLMFGWVKFRFLWVLLGRCCSTGGRIPYPWRPRRGAWWQARTGVAIRFICAAADGFCFPSVMLAINLSVLTFPWLVLLDATRI